MCYHRPHSTEVIIDRFPLELNAQTIIDYFKIFGDVIEIRIRNVRPANCTVKFRESWSAVAAAKNHFHIIEKKPLLIREYCSWEEKAAAVSVENGKDFPILTLSKPILSKIFNSLNFESKLQLSLSHLHFEKILVEDFRSQAEGKAQLSELKDCSTTEWHQYFKMLGKYLQIIEMPEHHAKPEIQAFGLIYNFIQDFSQNVEQLQIIKCFNLGARLLNTFNVKHLTKVELYDCGLEDPDVARLQEAKNLTQIGLGKNPKLVGFGMPIIKKLERLSLYECNKMMSIVFASTWETLKFVDLRGSNLHENYPFNENCVFPLVETLKLRSQSEFEPRINVCFPNLKLLEVEFKNLVTCCYDYISPFIAFGTKNLEVLKLRGNHFPKLKFHLFKKLRILWLDLSSYEGNAKNIEALQDNSFENLEKLNIQLENSISEYGLEFLPLIEMCTKLKTLSFGGNIFLSQYFLYRIFIWRTECAAGLPPLKIFVGNEMIIDQFYPENPKDDFYLQTNKDAFAATKLIKVLSYMCGKIDLNRCERYGRLDETCDKKDFIEMYNYDYFEEKKLQ